VQLLPAARASDDGCTVLHGNPLGRLLAGALLHVALGTGRLAHPVGVPRDTVELELAALVQTLVAHPVAAVVLALPALRMLDAGDRPVRRLDVEALVGLDHLERLGMDAIDGQMQVQVVGVGVQAVDGLVLLQPKLVEEDVDRLFDLPGSRLLALAPAEDVVVDRVLAAHGLL